MVKRPSRVMMVMEAVVPSSSRPSWKTDYLCTVTPFRALVALVINSMSQRPSRMACVVFQSEREKEGMDVWLSRA